MLNVKVRLIGKYIVNKKKKNRVDKRYIAETSRPSTTATNEENR